MQIKTLTKTPKEQTLITLPQLSPQLEHKQAHKLVP